VDLESIIEACEISVVERQLSEGVRGTIGEIGGRKAIILNRFWPFSSEGERRWVLAEELGHVLLAHRLVESTAPGQLRMGLLEYQRDLYEKEARAFAAELLMPLARIRARWFEESTNLGYALGEEQREETRKRIIRKLAKEFGVTATAIWIRLEQLKCV